MRVNLCVLVEHFMHIICKWLPVYLNRSLSTKPLLCLEIMAVVKGLLAEAKGFYNSLHTYLHLKPYFLMADTTLLKAYSQAYILITLMPVITSFMTRTRLSVSRADFDLDKKIMRYIPIQPIKFVPY